MAKWFKALCSLGCGVSGDGDCSKIILGRLIDSPISMVIDWLIDLYVVSCCQFIIFYYRFTQSLSC